MKLGHKLRKSLTMSRTIFIEKTLVSGTMRRRGIMSYNLLMV